MASGRLLALAVLLVLHAPAAAQSVTPSELTAYLRPGEDETVSVTVRLPDRNRPIDVLFLFDATESMQNLIDRARARALQITKSVRAVNQDVVFGVATVTDYGQPDGPYQLRQKLTNEVDAVGAAMGQIELQSGGDHPEAYGRGLFETRFLDWRPHARRFVVLFADAPPHDPEFCGGQCDVDPGRDGVAGTADDLPLATVVQQLETDGITPIILHDESNPLASKPLHEEAVRAFQYIADKTGGVSLPLSAAGTVPEAVMVGSRESYVGGAEIYWPREFRGWAATGKLAWREDGRVLEFPVTIQPPEGTGEGIYRFPLIAIPEGWPGAPEIGRSIVTVRIGFWNYPWGWLFLFLYLLLVLALLAAWRRRRRIRPYFGTNALGGVAWRGLVCALIIGGAIAVWRWSPGRLPPLPAKYRAFTGMWTAAGTGHGGGGATVESTKHDIGTPN